MATDLGEVTAATRAVTRRAATTTATTTVTTTALTARRPSGALPKLKLCGDRATERSRIARLVGESAQEHEPVNRRRSFVANTTGQWQEARLRRESLRRGEETAAREKMNQREESRVHRLLVASQRRPRWWLELAEISLTVLTLRSALLRAKEVQRDRERAARAIARHYVKARARSKARRRSNFASIVSKASGHGCLQLSFHLRCHQRAVSADCARNFFRWFCSSRRRFCRLFKPFLMKLVLIQRYCRAWLACQRARLHTLDLLWMRLGREVLEELNYRRGGASTAAATETYTTPPGRHHKRLSHKYSNLTACMKLSKSLAAQSNAMFEEPRLKDYISSIIVTRNAAILHRCDREAALFKHLRLLRKQYVRTAFVMYTEQLNEWTASQIQHGTPPAAQHWHDARPLTAPVFPQVLSPPWMPSRASAESRSSSPRRSRSCPSSCCTARPPETAGTSSARSKSP
jgi:hypothetical protein